MHNGGIVGTRCDGIGDRYDVRRATVDLLTKRPAWADDDVRDTATRSGSDPSSREGNARLHVLSPQRDTGTYFLPHANQVDSISSNSFSEFHGGCRLQKYPPVVVCGCCNLQDRDASLGTWCPGQDVHTPSIGTRISHSGGLLCENLGWNLGESGAR